MLLVVVLAILIVIFIWQSCNGKTKLVYEIREVLLNDDDIEEVHTSMTLEID